MHFGSGSLKSWKELDRRAFKKSSFENWKIFLIQKHTVDIFEGNKYYYKSIFRVYDEIYKLIFQLQKERDGVLISNKFWIEELIS